MKFASQLVLSAVKNEIENLIERKMQITLKEICEKRLSDLGLQNDPRYLKRFKWEIEEIIAKEKEDYFLDLYNRKIKYPTNQNNLLICWILGIVDDYDISKDPNCIYGEMPDIDVDYLPQVRSYIKEIWAPKYFGEDYVCNIGNYTTFGIKSALIDMARVHGESRDEVLALTKNLETKDDEGKVLTWDSAMRLHPELKKYCEDHPDIAKAAHKLLNRNRGMGVHAGGLIISRIPISDLVPLTKRKDAPQASAWVEGLHGQDLQPVGLIKFDLLVISNLLQIARCCDLIKRRHKIEGIFARPGESDWTDVNAWRSDPKALEMANRGDMKCIFQYDSEGIRKLVKDGGVDRFEDLVAYASLYRPGCLSMGMHDRYVERKRGREKYSIHPLMKSILEKTYGVMVYQEQIMKILHVVGNIPLKDCEIVRKAISKKKIELFIKYKEMFIINGQKNLQSSEEEVSKLWDQVEAFSEYGFNLSHACAYTYISMWLLCLKAHWAEEFYASILSCETLTDKIKEYKMEAKLHNVHMERLNINKSNVSFDLQGDKIYYGFSNIKGIGEEPAKRIVENQPYSSFEDFLNKFGTDSSVLKPLIGLRCFKDADPITLWKFAEQYKDSFKKIEDKKKRSIVSIQRYDEEFKELFPDEKRSLSDFNLSDDYWKQFNINEEITVLKEVECDIGEGDARSVMEETDINDDGSVVESEVIKYFKKVPVKKTWNRYNELVKLSQKRQRTIERSVEKNTLPTLLNFDGSGKIDSKLVKEFSDSIACEEKYYGFAWVHDLERSPDFKGTYTFDALKSSNNAVSPVELKILKVTETKSKKGTSYHQLLCEDVTGQQNRINVWADDWEMWSSEFKAGRLIRMRLQAPSGGFSTYTIENNHVGKYRHIKRFKNRSEDVRIFLMRQQEIQSEVLSDEEALAQFDDCIGNL